MEPWSLAFTRCRASELALSWAAFKVYNEEVEVEEEEGGRGNVNSVSGFAY